MAPAVGWQLCSHHMRLEAVSLMSYRLSFLAVLNRLVFRIASKKQETLNLLLLRGRLGAHLRVPPAVHEGGDCLSPQRWGDWVM